MQADLTSLPGCIGCQAWGTDVCSNFKKYRLILALMVRAFMPACMYLCLTLLLWDSGVSRQQYLWQDHHLLDNASITMLGSKPGQQAAEACCMQSVVTLVAISALLVPSLLMLLRLMAARSYATVTLQSAFMLVEEQADLMATGQKPNVPFAELSVRILHDCLLMHVMSAI